MGIKNFGSVIRQVKEGIWTATYDQFSGQRWVIDASIFCFRFCYNAQSKRPNSHIDGFYQLFMRLLKSGISPVLVFDGKCPAGKQGTVELRLKHKQKMVDKEHEIRMELGKITGRTIDQNTPIEEIATLQKQYTGTPLESQINDHIDHLKRLKKNIINISPAVYNDIYQLCEILGVPVIRANGEADAMCAKLYLSGQVDAVMSEDSDILLYGGGRLIRKFNWTNQIEVLDLKTMLRSLGISHCQLIDLAILLGTDYTLSTIGGVGPSLALKWIQSGKTLDQIVAEIKGGNGSGSENGSENGGGSGSGSGSDSDEKGNGSESKSKKSEFKRYHLPSKERFPYQEARRLISSACHMESDYQIQPFRLEQINLGLLVDFMKTKCH